MPNQMDCSVGKWSKSNKATAAAVERKQITGRIKGRTAVLGQDCSTLRARPCPTQVLLLTRPNYSAVLQSLARAVCPRRKEWLGVRISSSQPAPNRWPSKVYKSQRLQIPVKSESFVSAGFGHLQQENLVPVAALESSHSKHPCLRFPVGPGPHPHKEAPPVAVPS